MYALNIISFQGSAPSTFVRGRGMDTQTHDILMKYWYYPSISTLVFNEDGHINHDYNPVHNGIYIKHLHNWLTFFSLEQIHIINATLFTKEPWTELNLVLKFLGVPNDLTSDSFYFDPKKRFYCKKLDRDGCLPWWKGQKHHATFTDEELTKVKTFFRPYNKELYDLLGRDFHWLDW